MVPFANDAELSPAEGRFPCEPHTRTYTSRCVVEDGAPIFRVVHDNDGVWQFIGPVDDPSEDGGKLVCLHCIIERDPSIKLLAGLPVGRRALRDSVSDKWEGKAIEKEEEPAES